MPEPSEESYLKPYLQAARKHGAGFDSLLWASPRTQQIRFEAITRMYSPAGKTLLDVGCGRADFLGYLMERDIWPEKYIGIEGVPALASAAASTFPDATILQADFIREPARLFTGADVIVFSGSLNTMSDESFYAAIRRAYDAASEALVFNFLASPNLAARDYLFWRTPEDVSRFCLKFCTDVRLKSDYLPGDCTACLIKPGEIDNTEALQCSAP